MALYFSCSFSEYFFSFFPSMTMGFIRYLSKEECSLTNLLFLHVTITVLRDYFFYIDIVGCVQKS